MPFSLNDLTTNFGSQARQNANNQTIEDEINDNLLKRNNPRGDANQMEVELDMNGNALNNASSVGTAELVLGGESITSRASLIGPQGDEGPEGPAGPKGDQGIQGETGATGQSFDVDETTDLEAFMGNTASVNDQYSYLITGYSMPVLGSEANTQLDVRIHNNGNTTGTWRMYLNSTGTYQQTAFTWNALGGAGAFATATGVVNGDQVTFSRTFGAGFTSNAVEIFYEPSGYAGDYSDLPILYHIKHDEVGFTLDGTTALTDASLGSFIAVKDGTGVLIPETSIASAVKPIKQSYFDLIAFGEDEALTTANAAAAAAANAQSTADTNTSAIATNTSNISALDTRVTDAEADIVALQSAGGGTISIANSTSVWSGSSNTVAAGAITGGVVAGTYLIRMQADLNDTWVVMHLLDVNLEGYSFPATTHGIVTSTTFQHSFYIKWSQPAAFNRFEGYRSQVNAGSGSTSLSGWPIKEIRRLN